MTVRAKFKVDSIKKTKSGYGADMKTPLYTIEMSPVTPKSTHDPATGQWVRDDQDENTKFWQYTPCGSLTLGTVNEEAVLELELGGEYYLDLTKVG